MTTPTTAAYGRWDSPISAAMISANVKRFRTLASANGALFWTEDRPAEQGRTVICCAKPGQAVTNCLPAGFSVRSCVHEYGGHAFAVHEQTIYFVNHADQAIYRMPIGGVPEKLTTDATLRYVDFQVTPYGLIGVGEQVISGTDVKNFIFCVDLVQGETAVLVEGADFYGGVTFSPDFKQMAWLSWQQPNMPWDVTSLWVAHLSTKGVQQARLIKTKSARQAFFQPQWHAGQWVVANDLTNWWNLYAVEGEALSDQALFALAGEIGEPLWTLGMSRWQSMGTYLIASYTAQGKGHLLQWQAGQPPVCISEDFPYTDYAALCRHGEHLACIASAPHLPTAILIINCQQGKYTVVSETTDLQLSAEYLSQPEHLAFPSAQGRTVYGNFYRPKNPNFSGPESKKPPLIVMSHGGPTGQSSTALDLNKQYWLSRGYAIMDVNYSGSTGYGREYRERLQGQWGIIDVEDCEAAALYLVQQQWIAADQLAIVGSSAGGYTTLAALVFKNTFHVGASYYGVADLCALAEETHKFEAKYLDGLIGPYPEAQAVYKARAPIEHIEGLSCPVIFFQGEDDQVVPPTQAIAMYDALKNKGIPTALHLFPGEGHGFRQAQHKQVVLEAQTEFFEQHLLR